MTTNPMPAWLRARLEADGRIDATTGATRRARAWTCGRCGGSIFRGLDADIGALSRDCDPRPLNRIEEAIALLDHRRTFELRWLGDHYELDSRDQWRITSRPALSTAGVDILVEHECGCIFGSGSAPSMIPAPTIRAPLPETPPF
jgi:hypothetical protein